VHAKREHEESGDIQVRKFLGGAVAFLTLCGCNNTPQNPVDTAIVNPPPSPSGQPPLVAHQSSRLGVVFVPVSPGSSAEPKIGSDRGLIVRSHPLKFGQRLS
jgi:hypothetical protein